MNPSAKAQRRYAQISNGTAKLGDLKKTACAKARNGDAGEFISIEHPFFEYNDFKSERYFDVEAVKCTWNGFCNPEFRITQKSINTTLV